MPAKIISGLPPLTPVSVVDAGTGELVEFEEFSNNLSSLVGFVQSEASRLWAEHKSSLRQTMAGIRAKQPAEIGRQAGIDPDGTGLLRDVKAKSRIARLIRYSVVTSAKSYFENSNLLKQEPTFAEYLNLGAVDAQMAVLQRDGDQLVLGFKCWSREYLLTFDIPDYVLSRNIAKFTLPVIKRSAVGWGFLFGIEEVASKEISDVRYVAGIDLGRTEPYTLVVVDTTTRKRVAQYTSSKRIHVLVDKHRRINEELGFLRNKSRAYQVLGLDSTALERERALTRAKRNRLMREITWLIATEVDAYVKKWSPTLVAMEDLTWVNPKHGMSRWTHSKDQAAITHKLSRRSVKTKKISPRNTSQECCKCGGSIKHIVGKRLVRCASCRTSIDRDVNAATNIAIRSLLKRSKGSNCTGTSTVPEVVVRETHADKLKSPHSLHILLNM